MERQTKIVAAGELVLITIRGMRAGNGRSHAGSVLQLNGQFVQAVKDSRKAQRVFDRWA